MAAHAHVHLAQLLGPLVARAAEPARLGGGLSPCAVDDGGIVLELTFDDERAVLEGPGARVHGGTVEVRYRLCKWGQTPLCQACLNIRGVWPQYPDMEIIDQRRRDLGGFEVGRVLPF